MATDSVVRRVAQKELGLFFSSPVAWLFLTSFAAVCLFVFFWVESFFARNVADIRPLFEWMPILLIFLCAALTMRMWSDERRNGTLEHVLTQPHGLWQFVLGKFFACVALLVIALLCTLPLPLTVAVIAELDWGPVGGGYLAALLLGSAYISIGLYVSARTDNPIVSLIGSVVLCGALYFIGSGTLTDFFSDRTVEILRALGSGARFESITRGVLDASDLVYYLSLIVVFLTLNAYELERERWASKVNSVRHKNWHRATALLVINAILLNICLAKVAGLRLDLTEGRQYSLSTASVGMLGQLQEPLLIRGYFSAKTHPLLAPLVPRLRDLITEFARASDGRVQIEFVDPALHPELEQEANERYGITATPFQVSDRYQSALVNAYFTVLLKYGDEHETLGFNDLIEVKTASNAEAEVLLRNPEFDLTRAIKRVLYNYQLSGNIFEGIERNIEFIAYVSDDILLPPQLVSYRQAITAKLAEVAQHSGGKFTVRFIEPEARDGAVARQINDEWGFKPMTTSRSGDEEFYFYLTLADTQQVVQLPTDNFDLTEFETMLNTGLKRFASGFTRTVALVTPVLNQQMAKYKLGAPSYANLESAIAADYNLVLEDLSDGTVDPAADILVLAGPQGLDQNAVFAIDQYLMRGGTVVLATSPFSAEIASGQIRMLPWQSGLERWLDHMGISIGESLVLDEQSATFPAPVTRQSGSYEFQDVKMIDYPFFIDLRAPGLAADHPVTAALPQLTMAWASPISLERKDSLHSTRLLESSKQSWLSKDTDVMPSLDEQGIDDFRDGEPNGSQLLGVVVEGRFESYFNTADVDTPMRASDGQSRNFIARSPESARIVLYSSNDFLDDQIISAVVMASGTAYLGPLELLVNTLDWSLKDEQLLAIRSRAHFNRTLPPMAQQGQVILEYANYAMAIVLLLLIASIAWFRRRLRLKYYAQGLSL